MYNTSVNLLHRIQQVRTILKEQKAPAIFISNRENIFYLTSYQGFTDEGRDAFILITPTQQFLFTHSLYFEEVKKLLPDFSCQKITSYQTFPDQLAQLLQSEKIAKVGFEENDLTFGEYQLFHKKIPFLTPATLRNVRIQKDTTEQLMLKKACDITDKTFQEIQKYIKPGVTEEEISYQISLSFKKQHADNAFSSVVAFGKNAAIAHHLPDATKLQKNDTILLDFGAQYEKYCADMSRTIFIGEVPTNTRKIYQAVSDSLEATYEKLEKDFAKDKHVKANDLDILARSIIKNAGYPEYPHALGHGVGLKVHESPILYSKSTEILTENMAFTLEPGVYLPSGLGIRIEDVITLTDKGATILTSSPKELIVL